MEQISFGAVVAIVTALVTGIAGMFFVIFAVSHSRKNTDS